MTPSLSRPPSRDGSAATPAGACSGAARATPQRTDGNVPETPVPAGGPR